MAKTTILPPLRGRQTSSTDEGELGVNALYQELADAERQHRAEQFWKRFGVLAVGVTLVAVLGTAGFVYYQRHQQQALMTATSEMIKADELLRKGGTEEAAARFGALAGESGSTLRPVLLLRQAQALSAAGKKEETVKVLRDVIALRTIDPALRDTARLSLARHTSDPEEMRKVLAEASAPDAPFAPLAQQMRAALAMAENKPDEAQAALNAIDTKNANYPASITTRTDELRSVFTTNQSANVGPASMGKEIVREPAEKDPVLDTANEAIDEALKMRDAEEK